MNPPIISVVMPSYNSENFIKESIGSVQNQTFKNWELIVTDDASMDHTVSILKSFSKNDSRIKYHVNLKNSGAAVTRNNCLKMVQGRFIAFLDSDDLWYPTKLEEQLAFMKKNKSPISFTSYELVNEKGNSLNQTVKSISSIDYTGYLKNTIIGMSTSMIDTSLVKKEFKFVNIRTRQDCYLWMTLLKRGHIAKGIDKVLGAYRVREGSISANKVKAAKQVWFLYYHLEKLGLSNSVYYFSCYVFNAIKKRILC